MIFIGQRLKIPGTDARVEPRQTSSHVIYTVQPGDTLYSIAVRFHTSVYELKKLNPWLASRAWLLPGDKVKVPGKGAVSIGTPVPNEKPSSKTNLPSQSGSVPTPAFPKPPVYAP